MYVCMCMYTCTRACPCTCTCMYVHSRTPLRNKAIRATCLVAKPRLTLIPIVHASTRVALGCTPVSMYACVYACMYAYTPGGLYGCTRRGVRPLLHPMYHGRMYVPSDPALAIKTTKTKPPNTVPWFCTHARTQAAFLPRGQNAGCRLVASAWRGAAEADV